MGAAMELTSEEKHQLLVAFKRAEGFDKSINLMGRKNTPYRRFKALQKAFEAIPDSLRMAWLVPEEENNAHFMEVADRGFVGLAEVFHRDLPAQHFDAKHIAVRLPIERRLAEALAHFGQKHTGPNYRTRYTAIANELWTVWAAHGLRPAPGKLYPDSKKTRDQRPNAFVAQLGKLLLELEPALKNIHAANAIAHAAAKTVAKSRRKRA
jgi:hypothetical protein